MSFKSERPYNVLGSNLMTLPMVILDAINTINAVYVDKGNSRPPSHRCIKHMYRNSAVGRVLVIYIKPRHEGRLN